MRSLLIILITIFPLSLLCAQTIDTSELDKLQSGRYKLADDRIQVTFTDTASLSFVEKEMEDLGLDILSSEFKNIILVIENHPEREHIEALKSNEWVKVILNEHPNELTQYITDQGINPELNKNSIFKHISDAVFVMLNHQATMQQANTIIHAFPDLRIETLSEGHRTAIIKTTPRNEEQIIALLESKPYVVSVAYVGVLE